MVPFASITAGFVAVLVGFTGSAAIVFQAATVAGATELQIGSWMGALGIAMGVSTIALSLRYRTPVLTAWSTPGAAMLVTALAGIPMEQAIGAFIFSACLITVFGVTGWFEKLINKISLPIAAAMLAGVLVRFGMDVFVAMQTQFVMVFLMFCTYLICKRWLPRYAIIMVLALGSCYAWANGLLHLADIRLEFATPVFTMPSFSLQSIISIGIPLFVVTMASQNVPGVATLRASGYTNTPISPLISWTGIITLFLAPFGCYAINLAAITAAICMGKEAHEDPAKRYYASVSAGVCYLLLGIFGATVGSLLLAFPQELVLAIAGLALLSIIANGLTVAMSDDSQREPALITFLVTASGISLLGIGAAFWGLVAGMFSLMVLNAHRGQKD